LYPVEEPWDSPPLLIAGSIEAAGFEVRFLPLQNIYSAFDEEQDIQELKKLICENKARMVIFASDYFIASRSTATLYGIRLVSRLMKEDENPPIIGITGRLATTTREKLFSFAEKVDFLVVGEAEVVIGEIVSGIFGEGLAVGGQHVNVITPEKVNSREIEPARIEDVNTLPLPAYHLLHPALHIFERTRKRPLINLPFSIRTSLGCKFQCKFCAGVPNWQNYRLKSSTRIAAEIDYLFSNLRGIARLSFLEDEIFTLNEVHVREVTTLLAERNIRLDGVYTHSSLITPKIAKLLAPVTDKVFFGLDNADDGILKKMGKGQTLDTVLDAVKIAHEAMLKVHLEWIIGTPDETVDSLITSLGAIFNLLITGTVHSINSYVFCPHPGTEYTENHKAYGFDIIENFEGIQESGGFPASKPLKLSRNQVFSGYLMSQLVIAEAMQARNMLGAATEVRPPNRSALHQLFEQISTVDRGSR